MPGNILVVDPVATNRIVLRSRVATSLHYVAQAKGTAELQALLPKSNADLILLGPGVDHGSACALVRWIRTETVQRSIPVLRLTRENTRTATQELLNAGVSDVLSPDDQTQYLLAKIRKLLRHRGALQNLMARTENEMEHGAAEAQAGFDRPGRAILLTHRPTTGQAWRTAVQRHVKHVIDVASMTDTLSLPSEFGAPDVFVLEDTADLPDESLRLLAELRCNNAHRHAAVILVGARDHMAGPEREKRMAMALDIGADDVLTNGYHPLELAHRINVQMDRKKTEEHFRNQLSSQARDAIRDPLTGMHNRRYAMPHLDQLAESARRNGTPLAVLMVDIDRFKSVNDTHGHVAGDAVITEVATRLTEGVRFQDLVARIGGEEFLIALPNTSLDEARHVARKLCLSIGRTEMRVPGLDVPVTVTVSIGIAMSHTTPGTTNLNDEVTGAQTASDILAQADRALYSAKSKGRNQVTVSRHAA